MEFLKKHYEKIVLSVVLVGLAVAAVMLTAFVSNVQQNLDETVGSVRKTRAAEWVPLDLTTNRELIRRVEGPFRVELSDEHNVFNPNKWVKTQDGRIHRARELGAAAFKVAKIDPLHLTISFEGVSTSGERISYSLKLERETASSPQRITGTVPLGVQHQHFRITRIEGPPDAPTALTVELKGEKDAITVVKGKPYTRLIGYAADLVYPPENNKAFTRRKVGDTVVVQGDDKYKIVAITESEVVLSAVPSEKRATLKLSSAL